MHEGVNLKTHVNFLYKYYFFHICLQFWLLKLQFSDIFKIDFFRIFHQLVSRIEQKLNIGSCFVESQHTFDMICGKPSALGKKGNKIRQQVAQIICQQSRNPTPKDVIFHRFNFRLGLANQTAKKYKNIFIHFWARVFCLIRGKAHFPNYFLNFILKYYILRR